MTVLVVAISVTKTLMIGVSSLRVDVLPTVRRLLLTRATFLKKLG